MKLTQYGGIQMRGLHRRRAENAEEAGRRKKIESVFSFSVLCGPLRYLRLCASAVKVFCIFFSERQQGQFHA